MELSIDVPAPRALVWQELERIEDHVTWMRDAEAIRFHSGRHRGVGTIFDCDTKVGPLRLTDTMEIITWDEGSTLGVRHVGAVSGVGTFVLHDAPGATTIITWEERLSFPWWMGGALGATMARPIFGSLWRGNLRRLRTRIAGAS